MTLIGKKWLKIVIFLCALSFSVPLFADDNEAPVTIKDPYETYNRSVFIFNEFMNHWFMEPLANLYNKIMPRPLNKGVSNFFSNIDNVPTVLNDLLQFNFYQATGDAWRLGINSTIGLLGFVDVASSLGLEPNSEDFGLTLARWGYTDSNYLVVPFIGPSTVRDGVSWFVNYYFLTIYPYIEPPNDRYRLYFGGVLVRYADLMRFQGVLEQAAVDRYVFLRNAYMQRRAYQIQRNKELGNPYLMNKEEEKTQSS